ncbi:hypothetical protein A2721_02440 [Candidatus Gottesmanbacteria bacterium RIFCSPHIGHO2_01_FULL_47_48]|uniref:Uncharacterized protein n=1 Tax=Candidatus Gottesmanbacteria bacterium RIFCSPHIGHO2_01_FULL_47_48 TaxID=1798381 RepID=A0A1F6A2R7_9BACT|nr:MAG: hypothetical protein A2721_02440 [Candidatus Gottesmanbacteria bacterium RIFCSPHIGHO2_01_FULL_47_48]
MKDAAADSSKSSQVSSRGRVVWVLLLTLFLNLFPFHRNGSVATVLVLVAYFVFTIGVFVGREWRRQKGLLLGLTVFQGLVCLAILVTDNAFSRAIVILSSLLTTSGAIYLYLAGKQFFADAEEFILAPVNLGMSYFLSGVSVLGKILTGKVWEFVPVRGRDGLPIRGLVNLIIGLIVAVPVVFVLVVLLSVGDPVFNHFMTRIFQELGKIFDSKFWFQPITHIVFSAFLLGVLLPLAFMKRRRIPLRYLPESLPLVMQVSVVVGLVALVLGAFIFVEWPYVFASVAAETSLSQFGVATYSEYVKRGFVEFSLVAVIVYGVLWAGLGRSEMKGDLKRERGEVFC